MSEPDNDLERDVKLAAIYREAAQDAPPPALDSAILAAARREVGARPRPAGSTFGCSWRAPLSIAAVIVLSVSLVMLMREEAPELTAPPRADSPTAESRLKSPASADDRASMADRGVMREERKAKSIGLEPPQPLLLPAEQRHSVLPDAQRDNARAPAVSPSRQEAVAKPTLALEPAAGAAAGAPAENKARIKSESASADGSEPALRAQSEYAPAKQVAEVSSAPVAMAPPPAPVAAVKRVSPSAVGMSNSDNGVELAPGKWLERIEEMRKQGKIDEAKISLAEFRKRYPDYRLPDSLRDWAKP